MTTTTPTNTTKKRLPWSKIVLGVILTVLVGLQIFQWHCSSVLHKSIDVLESKQESEDARIEKMILSMTVENDTRLYHLEEQVKKMQKTQ